MVEITNIANPTILSSREISRREPVNAVAMSRIIIACLTDSSGDSRKAFLEAWDLKTKAQPTNAERNLSTDKGNIR